MSGTTNQLTFSISTKGEVSMVPASNTNKIMLFVCTKNVFNDRDAVYVGTTSFSNDPGGKTFTMSIRDFKPTRNLLRGKADTKLYCFAKVTVNNTEVSDPPVGVEFTLEDEVHKELYQNQLVEMIQRQQSEISHLKLVLNDSSKSWRMRITSCFVCIKRCAKRCLKKSKTSKPATTTEETMKKETPVEKNEADYRRGESKKHSLRLIGLLIVLAILGFIVWACWGNLRWPHKMVAPPAVVSPVGTMGNGHRAQLPVPTGTTTHITAKTNLTSSSSIVMTTNAATATPIGDPVSQQVSVHDITGSNTISNTIEGPKIFKFFSPDISFPATPVIREKHDRIEHTVIKEITTNTVYVPIPSPGTSEPAAPRTSANESPAKEIPSGYSSGIQVSQLAHEIPIETAEDAPQPVQMVNVIQTQPVGGPFYVERTDVWNNSLCWGFGGGFQYGHHQFRNFNNCNRRGPGWGHPRGWRTHR